MIATRTVNTLLIGLSIAAAACGGSNSSSKGAETATTSGDVELSSMGQLKAIPKDLHTKLEEMMEPIDKTEATINRIGELPEKFGVDAKTIFAMANATVENGEAKVKVDLDVDAKAKAEIEAAMKDLADVVSGLKAVPERATALGKAAAAATAKLPVLATKITTESQATIANPFGDKDAKAKAQADIDGVQTVQAEVQAEIQNVQQKVGELPGLASSALAKLGTSFAGGAGDSKGDAKGEKAAKASPKKSAKN